jgi:hypothetical protein
MDANSKFVKKTKYKKPKIPQRLKIATKGLFKQSLQKEQIRQYKRFVSLPQGSPPLCSFFIEISNTAQRIKKAALFKAEGL